jgi:hypothetical protein
MPQISDKRLVLLHNNATTAHEVHTWLRGHGPTSYRQGFEKLVSRLDKCINIEGEYVEI